MKSNFSTRKRQYKRKHTTRKVVHKRQLANNSIAIYNDPGRFCPDRLRCKLVYNDTSTFRTHALSNTMNWAYRSSAFDPDPLLGSGAIAGFTELANMYAYYLVHSMTLNLEINNQETTASILGIWPSNVVASNNSLAATDVIEFASNPQAARRVLPPQYGGKTRVRVKASGYKLFGRQFYTDLDYSGATGGNPVIQYGINIGITTGGGANIAFPVIISSAITYEVEFFRLRQLES